MPTARSKRIALVTDEILGFTQSSGAATANTFLALALADQGHAVQILYPAPVPAEGIALTWATEYERRNIDIRGVDPFPQQVLPRAAALTYAVHEALLHARPDVVVADDRYGSCYASVRSRTLGLEFANTLFVVYCHGTTAWIADAHRKVRRWPAAFEVEALERAAVELADVVVSPSAYMLDWMRERGWRLPRALVVPLLTRSAIGEAHEEPVAAAPIDRIAFFGRLEERKGLQPFIDALNAMTPDQLNGLEVVFVGKETPSWTAERVRAALSPTVAGSLAELRFETRLDQPEAIARLKRPGTLAIMPSLLDNSPMVIYECLEHGIPFLGSSAGGGPELVAEEDRARTFVEPTSGALQRRLAAMLARREECLPARRSFDVAKIVSLWDAVISMEPEKRETAPADGKVTAVIRRRGRAGDLDRCLHALRRQSRVPDQVVVFGGDDDISPATGDFVFVLDDTDEAEPECLATLLKAQAVSDADVVTCALRPPSVAGPIQFFHGDAGVLAVIKNCYGLVALYRRGAVDVARLTHEPDWLNLASLALADRRIASVPRPLVCSPRVAEDGAREPAAALAVARAFERGGPPQLRGLATLAASFAARLGSAPAQPSLRRRVAGLLRRAKRRGAALRGS